MRLGMSDSEPREADRLEFDAPPTAGSIAARIGAKNLLIIIVTMPFVFLVVVMSIIAIFGRPDDDKIAAAPATVRSTPVAALEQPAATNGARATLPLPASIGDSAAAIALPAGGEAGAISLDGDRLAVRIESPEGAMIVIYDLTTNAVIQTVPLVEAAN